MIFDHVPEQQLKSNEHHLVVVIKNEMIRNKSYIFFGDVQVITEILDGKTFHQGANAVLPPKIR